MTSRHHLKSLTGVALSGVLMALLAGCGGGAQQGANNAAAPVVNDIAPAAKPAPPPKDQTIAIKSDALDFSYAWPGVASAFRPLDEWLRGNAEKLRADAERDAKADQVEAAKSDYPFRQHSYEEKFAVVADTARVLILLSDGYFYTGGAHGMPINTAIIWDKQAGRRIATADMIDVARLANVGKQRFCDALDKERAERRGEPVKHDDPNELDDFVRCVDLTKQLVLPVSLGGKLLDTVRVVIGPYEAGPYAEGSYVIDLPMDDVLLTTVKDRYREAFGRR